MTDHLLRALLLVTQVNSSKTDRAMNHFLSEHSLDLTLQQSKTDTDIDCLVHSFKLLEGSAFKRILQGTLVYLQSSSA
jgi:hypothetical protein